MQSLTDGEVLKKVRKIRGLNQKECCQGIISRHTYSRIERNQTSLQFHILLELLERLNFNYDDFLLFKKEKDTFNTYRKNIFSLSKETIQENNPLELFTYLQKNKNKSIQNFHYYLLCKKKMMKLDFDQIEKIDSNDLSSLNTYINNLTFFSILDLSLFSDICDYLTYDTMKMASLKIIKQIKDSATCPDFTLAYQQAIHLSLYTITSIALKNEDYNFAKHLLEIAKDFLTHFPSHYFLMFFHFNAHTLNYKLTTNNYYLSKLFVLKDYMKELEDYQSVDKIENQIKLLIQQTASTPTNITPS